MKFEARRERTTTDGAYAWYNYAGFSLQSEEDAAGALDRTHVGRLADLTGSDPATAAARYFTHDMLGSTRGVWGPAKNLLGAWEPTPYGDPYTDTLPSDILHRFTGHLLDPVTEAYYAPYRYYEPGTARWTKADPLGMVDGPNMFAYVRVNPTTYVDPHGGVAIAAPLVALGPVGWIALGGLTAGAGIMAANEQGYFDDIKDGLQDIADDIKNWFDSKKNKWSNPNPEPRQRPDDRRDPWGQAEGRPFPELGPSRPPTGPNGKLPWWVKLGLGGAGAGMAGRACNTD